MSANDPERLTLGARLLTLPVGADVLPLQWHSGAANLKAVALGAWLLVACAVAAAAAAFASNRAASSHTAEVVESPELYDRCVAFSGTLPLPGMALLPALGVEAVEVFPCQRNFSTSKTPDQHSEYWGPCVNESEPLLQAVIGTNLLAGGHGVAARYTNVVVGGSPEPVDLELGMVAGRAPTVRVLGAASPLAGVDDLCSERTTPIGYGDVSTLRSLAGLAALLTPRGVQPLYADSMRSDAGRVTASTYSRRSRDMRRLFELPIVPNSDSDGEDYYPPPPAGVTSEYYMALGTTLVHLSDSCGPARGGIPPGDVPDRVCRFDPTRARPDDGLCGSPGAEDLPLPRFYMALAVRFGDASDAALWEVARDRLGEALCSRVARPTALQSASVAVSTFVLVTGLIPFVARLVVRRTGAAPAKAAGRELDRPLL